MGLNRPLLWLCRLDPSPYAWAEHLPLYGCRYRHTSCNHRPGNLSSALFSSPWDTRTAGILSIIAPCSLDPLCLTIDRWSAKPRRPKKLRVDQHMDAQRLCHSVGYFVADPALPSAPVKAKHNLVQQCTALNTRDGFAAHARIKLSTGNRPRYKGWCTD